MAHRSLAFAPSIAVLALVALPAPVLSADQPNAPERVSAEIVRRLLDDVVPRQLAQWHVPGAVIVVVKDDSILFSSGYGYADLEAGKPVDAAATLFRVGSVSKPFTATAVMQLVEQGKLDLNRDINDYLPAPGVPATFPAPITPASLLTHTSGLDERLVPARQARDVSEYLRYNLPDRLLPAGTVVRYSNHNYALAGWLIEAAAGEPFEQYMNAHVLGPLGMSRSTFGTPRNLADLASGYQWRRGRLVRLPRYTGGASPAASLLASGEDMAHFMIAHLNAGEYRGARLLSPASLERMQRRQFAMHPRAEGVCYGLWEHPVNGVRAVAHTGSTPGFRSNLVLAPGNRLGVFAAVNGEDGLPALDAIEQSLFDRFFPARAPAPSADAGAAPEEELRLIAGTYRGNYYSSRTFTKVMLLMQGGNEVRFERNGGGLSAVVGARRVVLRREEPDVYFDPEARRTVVFGGTGAGRYAIAGDYPMEKLRPDQTLAFQLTWLAACLLFILSVVVVWPAGAFIRRLRRKKAAAGASVFGRRARLTAAAAGAGYLLFVLAAASLMLGFVQSDLMLAVGAVPAWLKLLLGLPVCAAVLTLPVFACAVIAWARRTWSVAARIHYTLVAIALFATALWFNNWNLLGWRY